MSSGQEPRSFVRDRLQPSSSLLSADSLSAERLLRSRPAAAKVSRERVAFDDLDRNAIPITFETTSTRGKRSAVVVSRKQPIRESTVEEYFDGVVVEIAEDSVCLRTTSSEGEDALAWLSLEQIPTDELKFMALGVPARVSVVLHSDGTVKRAHEVRFLRPHQWYRPSEVERQEMASLIERRMQELLGPK